MSASCPGPDLLLLLEQELLDDAQQAGVADHVALCSDCQATQQTLADSLEPLPLPFEPAELLPAIREQIAAEEAAAAVAEQPTALVGPISLSCTYCHDQLTLQDVVYCASCLAPHHGECFSENSRCAAPGCDCTSFVGTRSLPPGKSPEPLEFRAKGEPGKQALLVLLVLGAFGGVMTSFGLSLSTAPPPLDHDHPLAEVAGHDADDHHSLDTEVAAGCSTPPGEVVRYDLRWSSLDPPQLPEPDVAGQPVPVLSDDEVARVEALAPEQEGVTTFLVHGLSAGTTAFRVEFPSSNRVLSIPVEVAARGPDESEASRPAPTDLTVEVYDVRDLVREGRPDDVAEWVAAYQLVLEQQRITLNLDDTPLGEAVTWLRGITNLNIVVANRQDADKRITLRVRNLGLGQALRLIAGQVGLEYRFTHRALSLQPPDDEASRRRVSQRLDPDPDARSPSAFLAELKAAVRAKLKERGLSDLTEAGEYSLLSGQLTVTHAPRAQEFVRSWLAERRPRSTPAPFQAAWFAGRDWQEPARARVAQVLELLRQPWLSVRRRVRSVRGIPTGAERFRPGQPRARTGPVVVDVARVTSMTLGKLLEEYYGPALNVPITVAPELAKLPVVPRPLREASLENHLVWVLGDLPVATRFEVDRRGVQVVPLDAPSLETRLSELARDARLLSETLGLLRERKVTLNFSDTPLAELVSFLANITGLNIVLDPAVDVDVTVTQQLKEIPLESALLSVLDQVGLSYGLENGVVMIRPRGQIDPADVREVCETWLAEPFGQRADGWTPAELAAALEAGGAEVVFSDRARSRRATCAFPPGLTRAQTLDLVEDQLGVVIRCVPLMPERTPVVVLDAPRDTAALPLDAALDLEPENPLGSLPQAAETELAQARGRLTELLHQVEALVPLSAGQAPALAELLARVAVAQDELQALRLLLQRLFGEDRGQWFDSILSSRLLAQRQVLEVEADERRLADAHERAPAAGKEEEAARRLGQIRSARLERARLLSQVAELDRRLEDLAPVLAPPALKLQRAFETGAPRPALERLGPRAYLEAELKASRALLRAVRRRLDTPQGPAAADVIRSVNGVAVEGRLAVYRALAATDPSQAVDVDVGVPAGLPDDLEVQPRAWPPLDEATCRQLERRLAPLRPE